MLSAKIKTILQLHTKPNLIKYSQTKHRLPPLLVNNVLKWLRLKITSIPKDLKCQSSSLLKVWTHQCECVLAQRVRRNQQMFSLYSRLWEEHALRQFLRNFRLHITRRSKEYIFSAVGVSAYNWEANRISDDEIKSHLDEMDYIKILKDKTIMCQICNKLCERVDQNVVLYCNCEGRRECVTTFDNWSLFIEQPDLIVWRRAHESGAFEYKVYGNYNDVSAEDFLSVQIDTTYRLKWDNSAVALEIIDKDEKPNSNSDVIYWEMLWPRLFSNRDYVFNRRFFVDKQQKIVLLLNKSSEHPEFPAKKDRYRINDYYSSMVIKPYTEINKPGLEFSLTYFDNPGVNMPSSVTSWVAYRAMPDFLTRLRAATIKYREYCEEQNCESVYTYKPVEEFEEVCTYYPKKKDSENIFDDLINHTEREDPTKKSDNDHIKAPLEISLRQQSPSSAPGAEVILMPSPIMHSEQSYWKYLHPTYYIS